MICRFSTEASRRELTPVDNLFLSEFMPDADPVDVTVYLYGLMLCYHPSMRGLSVADALALSPARVTKAFVYWQNRGLVHIAGDDPLTVEYLLATQPAVTTATPTKYRRFLTSLHALTAPREFSASELRHIYDCMELFLLDEGAVLELVAHCMQQKGSRVSVNYITKVAETWSLSEIRTFEQARAYLDDYAQSHHGALEVLKRWNKRRKPTQDEMRLYETWQRDWGFDPEAILTVCGQLTDVGSPTFTILNDRLQALHAQRKTTKAQIEGEAAQRETLRAFCREVFAKMGKVEPPTPTHLAQVQMYLEEKGLPREVILLAAEACATAERPYGKLKTILTGWSELGVRTVGDAKKQLEKAPRAQGTHRRKNPAAHGYAQHNYTNEQVEHLIADLTEDIH
ncbi:MAG: DnaD domain protein [Clostridiales bacterium]|nr:DnaD domain protein [Clostridiales bacterium]